MAYSLFIGRWQPFHRGHKKLIDSVLLTGKKVCIGIRDTRISKKNPYSVAQRVSMIRNIYGDDVEIIRVPNIDEVCYGRKVGYKFREIRLPKHIEAISATDIRSKKT